MTNTCYCGLADDFTAFGQPYPADIGRLPVFIADGGDREHTEVYEALLQAVTMLDPHLPYSLGIAPLGPPPLGPHIELRFASGAHGDGQPFDGPGGTLAHATGPPAPGWLHMDSSEAWIPESELPADRDGFRLAKVLAHELGHNVGLGHTGVPGSLMFPRYTNHILALDDDDLAGLEALYEDTAGSNRPPAMFWGEDPLIAGLPPVIYDIQTDAGHVAAVEGRLWSVRVSRIDADVAFRFTDPVLTHYSPEYPVVSGTLTKIDLNLQPVGAPVPPPPSLPPTTPQDFVIEVPAFTMRGRIG